MLPLLVGANLLILGGLPGFGVNREIAPVAGSYSRILNFGTFPLLLYFVLRRYLQSIGLAKPVMFALVSANLVNFVGNWILIYGHWGVPALGTDGSAWSTSVSRLYMAGALGIALIYYDRKRELGVFRVPAVPEWARVLQLLRLGLPAATHVFLEIAVFGAATALIARLDPTSLAAHQIALLVASVTFMVPLGISSAAAVRVGHAIGRRSPVSASRAGWTAIALGATFMASAAITFFAIPRRIASLYTADENVIRASVAMLMIAAVFQLFDAFQIVSAGALRGVGDTRTPMLCNLAFYWFVGLPLGYGLCFRAGWGAPGIWTGLCVALILIGSTLLAVWRARINGFRSSPAQTVPSKVL
jgi:MATE family multidrug resistance protein